MKAVRFILLSLLLVGAAGCWVAAIPRYDEIKRPVTAEDLAGEWVLSEDSLHSMTIDGIVPKAGAKHSIALGADGSCSYRTVLADGTYLEKDGRWIVRYADSESFKNSLDFHFNDVVISRMKVAMDSKRMILWESWGDPDAGIDLKYYKK